MPTGRPHSAATQESSRGWPRPRPGNSSHRNSLTVALAHFALGYLATATAWSHVDDVRATGDGVLALLARRLQERRPSELLPTVSAVAPDRANIARCADAAIAARA